MMLPVYYADVARLAMAIGRRIVQKIQARKPGIAATQRSRLNIDDSAVGAEAAQGIGYGGGCSVDVLRLVGIQKMVCVGIAVFSRLNEVRSLETHIGEFH